MSGFYKNFVKRVCDLVAAGFGLLLLGPCLLVIIIALWIVQGRPIFFRQDRPGKDGKIFTLIKFRTMLDTVDRHGRLLDDAERITAIGAFLRRTSLDELPELWNVLTGDMSIVGPRPLLTEYLDRYNDEHRRRHEVRPGITGWAQVSGRQTILFSQRMAHDVWYVDNVSLVLDLRILWMTVTQVLFSRGVIVGQHVDEVDDLGLSRPTLSSAGPGEQGSEH